MVVPERGALIDCGGSGDRAAGGRGVDLLAKEALEVVR